MPVGVKVKNFKGCIFGVYWVTQLLKKINAFKGIAQTVYYNNKNTRLLKAEATIRFFLVDFLKAINTAIMKCQCAFPFFWYSFVRDKHPQGSQTAEYIFVEDQIKGPYVLVGFHCSLKKLEIQQSSSIHIFLTPRSEVSFLSLKSDCWNRSNC